MPSSPTCLGPHADDNEPSGAVVDLLDVLCRRIGMEAAGLGRVDRNLLVVRELSGDAPAFGLSPGNSVREESGLYDRILSGEVPPIIADARCDPRTADAAIIHELGVRSYAVTPVLDAHGDLYGIVGCMSRQPRPALGPDIERTLGLLAGFLTDYVSDPHRLWEVRSLLWRRVQDLIDGGGPRIHLQPIVDLRTRRTVAVEALSRFPDDTAPEPMFAQATGVGLGPELETAAIHQALALLPALPPAIGLGLNVSPSVVTGELVELLLSSEAPDRLALEITEHEHVDEDHSLFATLAPLRAHGVQIVLDDLGTGYSDLTLLLHLRPDAVKLDRLIVHGMSHDPGHRAVTEGITRIAHSLGCLVVAEGIESPADLAAARSAGVDHGQGFVLGRPTADLTAACRTPHSALAAVGGS